MKPGGQVETQAGSKGRRGLGEGVTQCAGEMLERTGRWAWEAWGEVRYIAAVLGTVVGLGADLKRWRRTVRSVFARQVFLLGVQSVGFILVVAVLAGISVVVQLDVWTERLGQSQTLGQLLVMVVARELGPLLANFVLIVRGGSAIATELGIMKAGGEVHLLEALGIDPMSYLVMPQVAGMVVSAFALTVIFVLAAFGSGYGFGALLGQANADPTVFFNGVFKAVRPFDGIGLLLKCLLPAVLTGVICATEGLSVEGGVAEVPGAVKRALARSLGMLLVISVAISLLTYL